MAYQAEEVVRHWRATGELSHPDGSRISVELFRLITAAAVDQPFPETAPWEADETEPAPSLPDFSCLGQEEERPNDRPLATDIGY
jgi:hypothetical protein